MSTTTGTTPQGPVPAIGIPDSQDYPRLVYTAPYFQTVPLAELIEPSVLEAVEAALPALVPPYVDAAADAAVNARAVLLTGSTMSGPLYLAPTIPTQPSQAASMAYVDLMVSTAGVPEVPVVPSGQTWARQTGQWVPIDDSGTTFLALSGGTMAGQINMSGNAITNLPALPVMPNGAAPATWVLNQIAAQSLYQGTWNVDTYTPDLTQGVNQQNSFTWIAVTTSLSGVVVVPPIPGLQGQTVFNGDTIIWSAIAGQFQRIHSGGLTLDEANALFLQLAGGQMSGSLLLHANATQPTEAVTLQQMNTAVAGAGIGEAPPTGQLYGRNGQSNSWSPVLPLAGGTMTGALTLSGNVAGALNAVPLQQLQSTVSAAVAPMVPLAGGTMSGPLVLSGNAAASLGAVPLQQVTGMLGGYAPLGSPTFTGTPAAPTAAPGTSTTQLANTAFVAAAVGASASNVTPLMNGTAAPGTASVLSRSDHIHPTDTTRASTAALAGYVPLSGATMTGQLTGPVLESNTGRIVSTNAGNNPSVTVWSQGVGAAGMLLDGGNNLLFANTDGGGNYISTRAGIGSGGNFWTAAGLTAAGTIVAPTITFGGNYSLFIAGNQDRWIEFNTGWAWAFQFSTGNLFWQNASGSQFGLNFASNGQCFNLDGVWHAQSDERLKTDIRDYTAGLDVLMQVRPRSFLRTAEIALARTHADQPAPRRIGVIAQEIEDIIPECVSQEERDIDGTHYDDLRHYDSSPLLYTLVNAVKELAAKVAALEASAVQPR